MSFVDSVNIGRQFAGQSIAESIAVNRRLTESINAGLLKQMQDERSDELLSGATQSFKDNSPCSVAGKQPLPTHNNSVAYLGAQSQKSYSIDLHNPLNYAQRLCKLVNDSSSSSFLFNNTKAAEAPHLQQQQQLRKPVQTLDNLPSMIRKIFLKIREQLEDASHPIVWIIRQFQVAFKHDIESKLCELRRAV